MIAKLFLLIFYGMGTITFSSWANDKNENKKYRIMGFILAVLYLIMTCSYVFIIMTTLIGG